MLSKQKHFYKLEKKSLLKNIGLFDLDKEFVHEFVFFKKLKSILKFLNNAKIKIPIQNSRPAKAKMKKDNVYKFISSVKLPQNTVRIYKITQTISENNSKSKKFDLLKKKINKDIQNKVFQKANQDCTLKRSLIQKVKVFLIIQQYQIRSLLPGRQKSYRIHQKTLPKGKILTWDYQNQNSQPKAFLNLSLENSLFQTFHQFLFQSNLHFEIYYLQNVMTFL